jgi:pre-mRNA-splicing factor SYF1
MPTATPTFAQLSSLFPLTHPIPNPKTHPELITSSDLHREEDLLRNPNSFRAWWSAINNVKESYSTLQKKEKPSDLPADVTHLLGPLASPLARVYLQRLTYLYEVALQQFAGSFKLWKAYLNMRMSFVCGKPIIRKRAGGKKKFPEMKEGLEEEMEDLEEWENGLDGILGWEEWKALVATFERALMWLPKVCSVV